MKNLAAVILLFIGVFGLPKMDFIPALPDKPSPVIGIDEPSAEMKKMVESIAGIMRRADHVDRALWAQVWSKAARAVELDGGDGATIWGDTAKLRQFTSTALRISWRRIKGNEKNKYAGLNEAVESAFANALSIRQQPVDAALRAKYVELCRAVAWAGVGRDQ
jgi:hypothetical protein